MGIRTLDDLAVDGATVGVRVDINSPMEDRTALADDARLRAHVGTLSELLDRGGKVAVLAHQGRPGGDAFADLSAHAARLDDLLEAPVGYSDATFSADARERVAGLDAGEAVLLENTRFYSEEYMELSAGAAADTYLVSRLSGVLDAYVNDAFAASHRSQPSLVGFPVVLPGYAGRVMERELEVLGHIERTPTPRVYLLGGAKLTDALAVARSVLESGEADDVLTCGLVGNAFLLAAGFDLGEESTEAVTYRDESAVETARDLLDRYPERIHYPEDVAVERDGERREVPIDALPAGGPAKDIGSRTVADYAAITEAAGTAILNGPAGVFEDERFVAGTRGLFEATTRAEYSIVGGGDSAAAIRQLGIEGFDHVSTGGGAALRMLTGETLPAVEVLRQ